VQELDDRLREFDLGTKLPAIPDKEVLLSLAQNLPAVWNSPTADMRLKQRIVRILIEEIVADVDQDRQEVVLLIHWAGGRHTELRVKKNGLGKHQRCTKVEAVEVVRQMSGKYPDEEIAATLNRLGLRTGAGNTWSTQRVYALRHYHELPNNKVSHSHTGVVTLQEAAHRLEVSTTSVRRMIELKVIPAVQAVECAPWEIPEAALQMPAVQKAANNTKNRVRLPRTRTGEGQSLLFSES
jgi:hypothetical protein